MRIACPSKLPLCLALAACLLAAGLPLHAADKYPVRPVRFIIPGRVVTCRLSLSIARRFRRR